jgi:hypothetical protein
MEVAYMDEDYNKRLKEIDDQLQNISFSLYKVNGQPISQNILISNTDKDKISCKSIQDSTVQLMLGGE